MFNKKIAFGVLSTALVASLIAGCGSSKPADSSQATGSAAPGKASGKTLEIKLAHSGSDTHQYHIAALAFEKALEAKSNKTIDVKIYDNAKLGSEKDAVEGVINGTLDMTEVAADSSLANVVPEMNVFGIPFLLKDAKHVYSVLDGEIGKELLAKADAKGMKGLGYWEVGFRNMTTKSKPIVKPEDMKGLKMRVQPAPVWQTFMKTLGANPTAVNFNELYSALEQGVVDGQENPVATVMSMKFYEVQKNVSLTKHTYTPAAILMSNKLYKSLTDEQKKWLDEAIVEARDSQRKTLAEAELKSLEEMKTKGVKISEPDRAAFEVATKDVAQAVADKVPAALIEKIKQAAK